MLVLAESDERGPEADELLAVAEAVFDKVGRFDDLARDLFDAIVNGVVAVDDACEPRTAPVSTDDARARTTLSALHSLSPREREVLRGLMDGRCVDEIAGGSARSVATVRSHVHAILTKLDVNSQIAAVAAAHRARWA